MKAKHLLGLLFIGFLVLVLLISQGNLAYGKEARGVTKDSIKIGRSHV